MLLVMAFCLVLAVLALGMPTGPAHTFGPLPAAAATPSSTAECHGTIKVGTATVPFSKVSSTTTNTTTFIFRGTETDDEGGTIIGPCSFTGTFGAGMGPGPGTFSATQTFCKSCTIGSCAGLAGCKVCTGHPELATQKTTGGSDLGGTQASFVSTSPGVNYICHSYPAP
jgi:hypothetical protein